MSGGVLVATFFFQCGVLGGGWGGLCTWRVLRNMTKKKNSIVFSCRQSNTVK